MEDRSMLVAMKTKRFIDYLRSDKCKSNEYAVVSVTSIAAVINICQSMDNYIQDAIEFGRLDELLKSPVTGIFLTSIYMFLERPESLMILKEVGEFSPYFYSVVEDQIVLRRERNTPKINS